MVGEYGIETVLDAHAGVIPARVRRGKVSPGDPGRGNPRPSCSWNAMGQTEIRTQGMPQCVWDELLSVS